MSFWPPPQHSPLMFRYPRDTTRGSHYDNTSPLETTKIGAPDCVVRGGVPLIVITPIYLSSQLGRSCCPHSSPCPPLGSHRDVQLNHTETGIPFLQPLLISHCNLFQLKILRLMSSQLRDGCGMNFVTFVNFNDSH